MKLVIKRSKWLRGGEDSVLLNDKGKMCCLGFLAKACGVKPRVMRNVGTPQSLVDHGVKLLGSLKKLVEEDTYYPALVNNTELCQDLMEYNDDQKLSETKREAAVKKGLKKIGVDVTFVD